MNSQDKFPIVKQDGYGTLVFTIETGGTLTIGDATVRIITKGNRAKVVISAPKHIKVLRGNLKNAG